MTKIQQLEAQVKEARDEIARIKKSGSQTGYVFYLKEELAYLRKKLKAEKGAEA